jgi:hypothetical protein
MAIGLDVAADWNGTQYHHVSFSLSLSFSTMSNKRGNDLSQQRREDYEADDTIVSEVPQGPFLKASEDEMKRRRIVHVSGGYVVTVTQSF